MRCSWEWLPLIVFFAIIDTADQIQDTGTVEAPIFHGNLHFKDVHFSYIPDEEG
jgi:hypothetical protein